MFERPGGFALYIAGCIASTIQINNINTASTSYVQL